MKNLNPVVCQKFKAARREAGLSQSELAAEVGCKQSALSMFEQGDGTKLNDEVIEALSKKFGIALETVAEGEKAAQRVVLPSQPLFASVEPPRGYCPNPHCPSHHRYEVDGRVLLKPDQTAQDPVGGKFCALCGEIIERTCPNCGAPVHEGAICSFCGEPYVTTA